MIGNNIQSYSSNFNGNFCRLNSNLPTVRPYEYIAKATPKESLNSSEYAIKAFL